MDQLLDGLLKLGVRGVRLGQPARVSKRLRDATLTARLEAHAERGASGELRLLLAHKVIN